jgi:hypothetical protein
METDNFFSGAYIADGDRILRKAGIREKKKEQNREKIFHYKKILALKLIIFKRVMAIFCMILNHCNHGIIKIYGRAGYIAAIFCVAALLFSFFR